jgi:outer membrane lipoprotein-sorting protein
VQAQTYTPVKDIEAVKQKIATASKNMNSMQSNFSQEKYMSVMSQKIQSKGLFYFKKNNQVRWEYTEPYKYIIVLAGGKIQIKDEKKVSEYDMNANKAFKQINDMMIQLVQGNVLNSTSYIIKYSESSTNYLLDMTPTDKKLKSMFKNIQLYFDKNTYEVSSFKMIENNGDYTLIKFSNKKQNVAIDASKFVLK